MNPFQKDYFGQTTINPLGAISLAACCIAILTVQRKHSLWPILVIACFVSSAQRIAIASINFDLLRIITICGWIRLLSRAEAKGIRWCTMDGLFTLWALSDITFEIIRTGTQNLVTSVGYSCDAVSMYFLFRFLVRDYADVRNVVRGVMWLAIPSGICFMIEYSTAHNMFAVFGGVKEVTWVREGKLRCQGAFDHPLIAGCFWATWLPLIVSEWWQTERRVGRFWVVSTALSAIIIVWCTSSATCLTGIAFGLIGGLTFFARGHLRAIRWSLLLLVIGLHLSMQAPVWHLITRVDIVGGNSGFQRFQLIDGAVNHFDEWWLIGSSVGTAHWGWACYDVCDYYVVQCLHGGVIQLVLFILILAYAFRCAGRAIRSSTRDVGKLAIAWASGVCILVHCQNCIGLGYFGQMPLVLYMSLAIVVGLAQQAEVANSRVSRPMRTKPTPLPLPALQQPAT